jgi:hypothetical protein
MHGSVVNSMLLFFLFFLFFSLFFVLFCLAHSIVIIVVVLISRYNRYHPMANQHSITSNTSELICLSSSSSSDEDETHDRNERLPTTIDAPRTTMVPFHDIKRVSLLPAFPSLHHHGVVVYRHDQHLLLANVSRSYSVSIFLFLSSRRVGS